MVLLKSYLAFQVSVSRMLSPQEKFVSAFGSFIALFVLFFWNGTEEKDKKTPLRLTTFSYQTFQSIQLFHLVQFIWGVCTDLK